MDKIAFKDLVEAFQPDTDNFIVAILGAIAMISILTPNADKTVVPNIVSGMIGYLGASAKLVARQLNPNK